MMSVTIDRDARFDGQISSARLTGHAGKNRASARLPAGASFLTAGEPQPGNIRAQRHLNTNDLPASERSASPGRSYTRPQESAVGEQASSLPGRESLKCVIHATTPIREEQ
ncbi:MAG TPA: hypothetical protein VKC56_04665 [Gallionellaceae bacterium]|nr:hypothetical protein [Gallionellaceae bacterium]